MRWIFLLLALILPTNCKSRSGSDLKAPVPKKVGKVVKPKFTDGVAELSDDKSVYRAIYSPDGSLVATSGKGYASIWDVATGKKLKDFEHGDYVISLAFSPDGSLLATGARNDFTLIWDINSAEKILSIKENSEVKAISFSSSGSQLLTAPYDKTANIWDAKTGKKLKTFAGHTENISAASFSPDDSLILTGSYDKTALLWDAASEKQLHKLAGHTDQVNSASFSQDGLTVVTSSSDKTCRLWDVKKGVETSNFQEPAAIFQTAIFPDGKHVVTGLSNGHIHIWSVEEKKVVKILNEVEKSFGINAVSISRDGSMILSVSDNRVLIWDVSDLK